MTDLASALADTDKLADFEGVQVLRTQVAITNAGDGLSKAMAVDPLELHLGRTVHVVLECIVQKVQHVPTNADDPAEGVARVHVLKAGRASLVDGDAVRDVLDSQADRILRAKEAAAGIQRLSIEADEDEDPDPDGEPDPDEAPIESEATSLRRARGKRR